ncbi:MAG: transketolase [Deltaproteobacteria bacterium]|nr:transketolase [Deltaproteobacteria bacterium]
MKDRQEELTSLAREARRETVRMIGGIGVGHVGGCLSLIEVLVHLYYREMNIRPEQPDWGDRDRLVMSKGHAGPALYAMLGMRGYFSRDLFATLNRPGTCLPSHCDMRRTPGVDMSAGSLGQGLSCAVGTALAARLDKKQCRVFCILGDGEQQEGQVWEAAMYAAAQKLDNLTAILDDNGMQIDGMTDDINSVRPMDQRWGAFGWATTVIDGHDFGEIEKAFAFAGNTRGKPTAIVMKTVKGKGISIAENKCSSHSMTLTREQTEVALRELQ